MRIEIVVLVDTKTEEGRIRTTTNVCEKSEWYQLMEGYGKERETNTVVYDTWVEV